MLPRGTPGKPEAEESYIQAESSAAGCNLKNLFGKPERDFVNLDSLPCGLPVEDDALLPFLPAARAHAVVMSEGDKAGRATFAEGLASSYEAFLETRSRSKADEDEEVPTNGTAPDQRVNRYVWKLAICELYR